MKRTMINIEEAHEMFDEYIINKIKASKKWGYSLYVRTEMWKTAQKRWISMTDDLYEFGILRLRDKREFKRHVIYVTNKLIGDLVDTAYDMSQDYEMRRIYPHIKDDWRKFIGWTPELLAKI